MCLCGHQCVFYSLGGNKLSADAPEDDKPGRDCKPRRDLICAKGKENEREKSGSAKEITNIP